MWLEKDRGTVMGVCLDMEKVGAEKAFAIWESFCPCLFAFLVGNSGEH